MVVFWTSISRFRWTPHVVALAAFLLLFVLWQEHKVNTSRNRTYTQLDLAMISDSLMSLSADSAAAIPRDSVANLDARVLYGLLSATNSGSFLLEHQKDWDRNQELLDLWGRPFHIQLVYPEACFSNNVPTAMVGVRIWSAGPNGQDELGKGDDITCQTVAIRLHK